jgi:hypothetical protein
VFVGALGGIVGATNRPSARAVTDACGPPAGALVGASNLVTELDTDQPRVEPGANFNVTTWLRNPSDRPLWIDTRDPVTEEYQGPGWHDSWDYGALAQYVRGIQLACGFYLVIPPHLSTHWTGSDQFTPQAQHLTLDVTIKIGKQKTNHGRSSGTIVVN